MIVSRLVLKNWRNFQHVDARLGARVFLVGPNASGKSNLLDALRFLRDIAKQGGGLQYALDERGGLSKVRCLAARREPDIEIAIHLAESVDADACWGYEIGIAQEVRGYRQPYLSHERVWKGAELLVERPDPDDHRDRLRLTQTHLEQINSNAAFRDIARLFESILYLHLVPQLLRFPESFAGREMPGDPFGRGFLERVAKTPENVLRSRLRKIESALQLAVPQLKDLSLTRDARGVPHLEAVYEHWRPHAGKQREDQFSDGTLRLIALLWSLLEWDSPLLLEEPELSLHAGIVAQIPALMHRLQRQRKRQVLLSTHSADLLSDKSITGEEVLLLKPGPEGTTLEPASSMEEVCSLLAAGFSVAEAALPRTAPPEIDQLSLFE